MLECLVVDGKKEGMAGFFAFALLDDAILGLLIGTAEVQRQLGRESTTKVLDE